jgi:GxxExxY protein
MEGEMTDEDLTHIIIGCAYKVHNTLGPGFLEKVYENALRIELEKAGFRVKQQEPIRVSYDGQIVGEYYADLWVNERVVVELKAALVLAKEHEVLTWFSFAPRRVAAAKCSPTALVHRWD